jgi:hypothetical protein
MLQFDAVPCVISGLLDWRKLLWMRFCVRLILLCQVDNSRFDNAV